MSVSALGMGLVKKKIQAQELEKSFKSTKAETSKIEQQLQQVHDIEHTLRQRLIFTDLVQEIIRLLPPQLSLVGLAISDGHILSFQGVSSKPGDINQLQKNMVESPFFYQCQFGLCEQAGHPGGGKPTILRSPAPLNRSRGQMKKLSKREVIILIITLGLAAAYIIGQAVIKPVRQGGEDIDNRLRLN